MFELQKERAELLEKIEELFSRKRYPELRDLLLPMEAADIASLCRDLDEKVPVVFRLLPKELAAEVFVELDRRSWTSSTWTTPPISWRRCPPEW